MSNLSEAVSLTCMQVGTSTPLDQDQAERRLLARVVKRERAALSELYERFQRPLFSYLLHMLSQKEQAEDVLQEVMLIVWQKAGTFRGAGTVRHWLFGIAHHQAFKVLRVREYASFLELEAALDVMDERPTPEMSAIRRATSEEIGEALHALSPEHREVLELAFFQDFSCKEIAAIVRVPEGTVKSRLSYGRRALKAALLRNGWEV